MHSPEPGAAVNDALILSLRHEIMHLLSIKRSKLAQGCDDLTKALRYMLLSVKNKMTARRDRRSKIDKVGGLINICLKPL